MDKSNNTSNNKVTDEELKSLREAFTLYDTDKNGAINLEQFANILKSLNIETDDKKIQIIVNQVDNNHDGSIDFDEFVVTMTTHFDTTTAEPDTCLRKWRTYPTLENNNNSQQATQDNKSSPNKKHYKRMSRHETDELQLCFAKFDKNGDGQISVDELKEVMNGLGEKLTEHELREMMKDADTNRDGYIDFEEFKALMPSLNTTSQ